MRRVLSVTVASVLLVVALAPTAVAQQRLFALTPREIVEVDTAVSSLGRVMRRTPVSVDTRLPVSNLFVAAGGTLIAWVTNGVVAFLDTRTGAIQRHGLPGFTIDGMLGTDASSFQLMASIVSVERSGVLVADLRTLTTRVIDLGPAALVGPMAYASRANRLFVAKAATAWQPKTVVDVLDAADGSLVTTLSVAPAEPRGLAASPDGTRLYVSTANSGTFAFDTASGTAMGLNLGVFRGPDIDETRRRVLVESSTRTEAGIAVLDPDSLEPKARAPLPRLTFPAVPAYPIPETVAVTWDVSPRSATIIALEQINVVRNYFGLGCSQSRWVALHADTGQVRATGDAMPVTGTANCEVELVRLTEPGPPSGFTALQAGRRVSFSWAPEAATRYELEAGATPGATNLTIPVTGTEFAIDGVPPGVYYVRVRAVNVIGKSAASRELRIIVE